MRFGKISARITQVRQAMELRAKGLSFGEIGRQMGVSRSRAQQLFAEGQNQTAQKSAEKP